MISWEKLCLSGGRSDGLKKKEEFISEQLQRDCEWSQQPYRRTQFKNKYSHQAKRKQYQHGFSSSIMNSTDQRWEWRKVKKPESGGLGVAEGPWWRSGATPPVTVRGQSQFHGTLYSFTQPLTKYSLLSSKAFFQRNKPGNALGGGQGAKPPEAEGFFWIKGMENHISWHFTLFQTATHKILFTVL